MSHQNHPKLDPDLVVRIQVDRYQSIGYQVEWVVS